MIYSFFLIVLAAADMGRDRDDRCRGGNMGRDGDRGSGGGGNYPPPRKTGGRRTDFGVIVTGLPRSCSWQDLKDFMRKAGDVVYADVDSHGDGVVDYSNRDDMERAVDKLDDTEFKNPYDSTFIRVKIANGGSSSSSSSSGGKKRSPSRSPSPAARDRSRSRDRDDRSGGDKDRDSRRRSPSKSRSPSPSRSRSRSRSPAAARSSSPVLAAASSGRSHSPEVNRDGQSVSDHDRLIFFKNAYVCLLFIVCQIKSSLARGDIG